MYLHSPFLLKMIEIITGKLVAGEDGGGAFGKEDRWGGIQCRRTKCLNGSRWRTGNRFGFELIACIPSDAIYILVKVLFGWSLLNMTVISFAHGSNDADNTES